jgi:hypothetical protein
MYGNYEEVGLVEVTEQDIDDDSYSWDVLGVWYHPPTDSYRVARDGGCSCNSPWETYYTLDDYGPPLTYAEARKAIQDVDFYQRAADAKVRAINELHEFDAGRKERAA